MVPSMCSYMEVIQKALEDMSLSGLLLPNIPLIFFLLVCQCSGGRGYREEEGHRLGPQIFQVSFLKGPVYSLLSK